MFYSLRVPGVCSNLIRHVSNIDSLRVPSNNHWVGKTPIAALGVGVEGRHFENVKKRKYFEGSMRVIMFLPMLFVYIFNPF